MRRIDRPGESSQFREHLALWRSRRGRSPWVTLALAAGLVACVTTWAPPERYYHRTAPVENPGEPVGTKECVACHEDVQGHEPAPEYHEDCEACHGPGELHWESEATADIRFPSNEDCGTCHEKGQKTLLSWTTSEHERTGVLCSDCHNPHNREPQSIRKATKVADAVLRHASGTTQMCASCHPDVSASMNLPSHHPMWEGMVGCTDCHKPHQDRRMTLGARTSLCTSCHQDHAGPWVFEHAPVAEDCSYCHAPHGSSASDLLETNEPGACITCHTVAESGAVHEPWAFVSRCTDCHGSIHGSYSDPHLRQ